MNENENVEALLKEAFGIKGQMDALNARLKEINGQIAAHAIFKADSKTASVAMGNYSAKVQLKQTVSWDQDALKAAFHRIGGTEFSKAFAYEFKPISAKALNAWLASPDTPDEARKMVFDARTIKEASPSVSYVYTGD